MEAGMLIFARNTISGILILFIVSALVSGLANSAQDTSKPALQSPAQRATLDSSATAKQASPPQK